MCVSIGVVYPPAGFLFFAPIDNTIFFHPSPPHTHTHTHTHTNKKRCQFFFFVTPQCLANTKKISKTFRSLCATTSMRPNTQNPRRSLGANRQRKKTVPNFHASPTWRSSVAPWAFACVIFWRESMASTRILAGWLKAWSSGTMGCVEIGTIAVVTPCI